MPIDKKSAAQFAADIASGITSRDANADTAFGPIRDWDIQPQSVVFEGQNDRARTLSLLLALVNIETLTGVDSDLEAIVGNEGETRILGSSASTTAVFARDSAPSIDAVVQRGYPVGSAPDAATGQTITFVTTEARTMTVAAASSFFNLSTQRYELSVPVISISEGSVTRVGANRVNRPLRPLAGFDSVTNPNAAVGGRDRETNPEMVDRYFLAILGRQTGTPAGIERAVRADFPDVESQALVFGNDPLLLRAATDGGAVDVWIKGDAILQQADNVPFLGVGQLMVITSPPLVAVVSVASGSTYIEGSDYDVVFDETGASRSTRSVEGIRFRTGGPTALPAIGAAVTITYTYDNLIRSLQANEAQPEVLELGRDSLYRRGIAVPIIHTARLRVLANFNPTTILGLVRAAILAFIAALPEGAPVEESDIQGVVRVITGVDNYVTTRLTRSTVASGTGDVAIAANEFATLVDADLSISFF